MNTIDLSQFECECCGMPGTELEHLPGEGNLFCPRCGCRTPDDLVEPDETPCRVCGCTDSRACDGGCYWVEDDLCSACAETLDPEE